MYPVADPAMGGPGGRPPPIDQHLGLVMAARLRHGGKFSPKSLTFGHFLYKNVEKAFIVFAPWPLTRGSAPGPRWGLRPQTPVYARAPRARHGPPLANPGSATACTVSKCDTKTGIVIKRYSIVEQTTEYFLVYYLLYYCTVWCVVHTGRWMYCFVGTWGGSSRTHTAVELEIYGWQMFGAKAARPTCLTVITVTMVIGTAITQRTCLYHVIRKFIMVHN